LAGAGIAGIWLFFDSCLVNGKTAAGIPLMKENKGMFFLFAE